MRDYTVLYLDTSGDEWIHKSQVLKARSAESAQKAWEEAMEASGRPREKADWHLVRVLAGAYQLTPLAANDGSVASSAVAA